MPLMRYTAFTILLMLSVQASAQQQMGSYMAYGPETKYLSTLNYRAYQSKNGYLWFGTTNGLIRFDGKRYINYFSNYANENSPADNTIFDITEDKNGDLWFAGFYHGATRYNQRTGKFKKYSALSKDNTPYYGINRLLNDSKGNFWLATSGRGLAKYIFEKDSFEFYFPEPNASKDGSIRGDNHITDIEEDKNNSDILWIGTFHGLYSFDKTKNIFTACGGPDSKEFLITSIQQDLQGLLWIGTWGSGLNCFNLRSKTFDLKKAISSIPVVYELTLINDSTMYAACLNSGLYKLNTHDNSFTNITPPRNAADPTAHEPDIQKVSVTPDAGTFIGGNYYVYQQHPDYVRLKKSLSYPGVTALENVQINNCLWDEQRQQYWVATSSGAGMYLLDKNAVKLQPVTWEIPVGAQHYFYGLAEDKFHRVFTLVYKDGIYLCDDAQKKYTRPTGIIPLPDTVLKNISRLAATKNGDLWMLYGNNFIYWNIKQNTTEQFPVKWDTDFNGVHDLSGAEMAVDPDGNAWLFTKNGMFNCIRAEKKLNHIFKTGTGINDLASSIVLAGAFNKNNDLWITNGNGIQVLNRKNYSVLSSHDVSIGLPSMLVRGIATDSNGRVWAALANGLGLFDPKTKTWQLYNRLDGLERDYLDNNLFVTSNNKIFINQSNGFLFKDVDELMPQSKPPLMHVTNIMINHEPYVDSLLPEFISRITMPYDKNNIDIEFAAMDWVYPFKTSYHYKIDGVPAVSTWNPIPEARVSLTALPPGNYVLHLQALNGNGVWSKEVLFTITIKPPFWKTWWFIATCIILLTAFFYALYRYRINRFIEMQSVRNAISRDLHDEIGATLSSVNMLSAVALKKAGSCNEVSPIIQQIKDSVQQAGESMDDIVWSVNPANDSAQDTFSRIRKYVTDLVEQNGISCTINIDEKNDDVRLSMELRRDIYLVCKEAVNNALKYSGCSELQVSVFVKNNNIEMEITDNGKGFNTAVLQNTQRNGIGNMRHRLSKHKGSFEINSVIDEGTLIRCVFPL